MLKSILSIIVIGGIYVLYYLYVRYKNNHPTGPAPSDAGDPEKRAALVRELGLGWGRLYDATVDGNVDLLGSELTTARGNWPRYHRLCQLAHDMPIERALGRVQSASNAEFELVAACACSGEGWRIRGHGGGSSVSEKHRQQFREWQGRARERLLRVTAMDPTNPTPWALLVSVARNLTLSDEDKKQYAQQALARFPGHFGAVSALLEAFAPHWHSDENAGLMLSRELAQAAPDNTLVAGCVILAYVGKWHNAFHFGDGDAVFAETLRRPEVQQEIARSYQRAIGHVENEWSPAWLSAAAALLARAGMRELAASAFQRLGERADPDGPWYYISKTAKLSEGKCFDALRSWAQGTRKHPCRDLQ